MSRLIKVLGEFEVDESDQKISRNGAHIPLTLKATAILHRLIETPGQLVSHEELLESVWPGTHVEQEALKVYIFELRRALGDSAKEPRYIESVLRRGYRLIAPVRDIPALRLKTSTQQDTLIGRDDILHQLFDELQKAQGETRRMVFVTGKAGIGKTAVIGEFLERIESFPEVYACRGQSLDLHSQPEPFFPLLEALAQLNIPGYRHAIETHAPTWLTKWPSLLVKQGARANNHEWVGTSCEPMLREVCDLLEAITAEHTLVLVLEDVQWADEATSDFLSAVARREEKAKLLILCSLRDNGLLSPGSSVATLSRELEMKRLCQVSELQPLPEPMVRAFLKGAWGAVSDSLVHKAARYTGGIPLYLGFVANRLKYEKITDRRSPLGEDRLLYMELPRFVEDVLLAALEPLSPLQRQLVEDAALVGDTFSTWTLSVTSSVPVGEIEAECEALANDGGILRLIEMQELPDGTETSCFEFRPGLYQHVISRRIEPAHRVRAQRALADAIEKLYKGRTGDRALELAWRYEQCHEWKKATDYLVKAADQALRRREPDDAVSILAQARSLTSRFPNREDKENALFSVLLQLVSASVQARNAESAKTAVEGLASMATTPSQWHAIAEILLAATQRAGDFSYEHALRMAESLRDASTHLFDARLRAIAEFQESYWRLLLQDWNVQDLERCKVAIPEIYRSAKPSETAYWNARYADVQFLVSDYDGAARFASSALRAARRHGDMTTAFAAARPWGFALLALGRWGEYLHISKSMRARADRIRNDLFAYFSEVQLSLLQLECMDYQSVLNLLQTPKRLSIVGHELAQQYAAVCLARAQAGSGMQELALKTAIEAERAWGELIPLHLKALLKQSIAQATLALGNLDTAFDRAQDLLGFVLHTDERTWHAWGWWLLSRVHLERGDLEEAQAAIVSAEELVEKFGLPLVAWRVYAQASRIFGRLHLQTTADRYRLRSAAATSRLAVTLKGAPVLQESFRRGAEREVECPENAMGFGSVSL